MDDADFEKRLKIAYFRGVTNQLLERKLITPEELKKISKYLEKMEADLIAAKPRKNAPTRKLTTV